MIIFDYFEFAPYNIRINIPEVQHSKMGSLRQSGLSCQERRNYRDISAGSAPSQKRDTNPKLQQPSSGQLPLFTRYAVTAFLAAKKLFHQTIHQDLV